METVIVIGIVAAIAYWAFKNGKREGSRKGYGAGRRYKRRR